MAKRDYESTEQLHEKMKDTSELQLCRKDARLLINNFNESKTLGPIIGYAQEPILTLADACAPLTDSMSEILKYVSVALERTPNEPADGLTRDESASIYLYTMEWVDTQGNLYSNLNRTLRTVDREGLRPWFKYLKLFLSALAKLPCVPPLVVWRGVRTNISAAFPPGIQVIWWGFSSTTTSLTVLESNLYLGTVGERTLLSIEVLNGRKIRNHSHFQDEEEILLLPGTYMEVQSQLSPAPDLHIIHLKQMLPKEVLLEPPFEDACLYPKNEPPNRHWYMKKTFWIPMGMLVIVCIVGIVVGCVVGLKHSGKTSDAVINWNGSNSAVSCDFKGNDLFNVPLLAEFCRTECAQTQGCTHYTWTSWNGGTCWMKTGNVSKNDAFLTNDSTMLCGIMNGDEYESMNLTVLWNGNNWAMSCDFTGNDLSNVLIAAELCGGKCAQTQGCTHYTWTQFNGGTCWMKSGNVSKSDAFSTNDTTMLCGVTNGGQQKIINSTVVWNGNNWAMSCDFTGNDLSNVLIAAELCGGKCAQTQGCTHFTWTQFNGGTCWMKSGNVSKSDAFSTNDSTMLCGVTIPT